MVECLSVSYMYICVFLHKPENCERFFTKIRPAGTPDSSESSVLSRLVVHIPLMSHFICGAEFFHTAGKKKSIFSKVPTLTSADIDGKQPNQCSLSMAAAWNVGRAAPHLIPYYPSDGAATGCLRVHKGAMTAPHVWGCVGTCACVCGPCVCIHFLPVCFAPSTLPQIPHPNHNYNVISRVRQCPRCCFTLSFSPLLWISNAVTLSSKSCTARSQTGVWHVCFYRLGWGRGLFGSTFLQLLTVQARKRGLTIARVC